MHAMIYIWMCWVKMHRALDLSSIYKKRDFKDVNIMGGKKQLLVLVAMTIIVL